MRFTTSFEHRDFFSKNGYIEFEQLISLDECALLRSKTADLDLWRQDPLVKKISLRSQYGEIASELSHKKILRIGFDLLLDHSQTFPLLESSIQPFMGVLIILSEEKMGSVLFFEPHYPLPKAEKAFLIVYCESKTLYQFKKNDPYTHHLKKLGYVFGDLIKSHTHPLITGKNY